MAIYTTIRKKIKEFDVLISNDPIELNKDEDLYYKNLLRVYCRTETHYVTFLISAEMLKDGNVCDDFIHKLLTLKFNKLSIQ